MRYASFEIHELKTWQYILGFRRYLFTWFCCRRGMWREIILNKQQLYFGGHPCYVWISEIQFLFQLHFQYKLPAICLRCHFATVLIFKPETAMLIKRIKHIINVSAVATQISQILLEGVSFDIDCKGQLYRTPLKPNCTIPFDITWQVVLTLYNRVNTKLSLLYDFLAEKFFCSIESHNIEATVLKRQL